MQQALNLSLKNKEIINSIADLLCKHQFRLAQSEFFDLHCSKFEKTEENEHSHHDLFKSYTKILDDTIDSKLMQKFKEEEVKQFYADFTKDHQTFKSQPEFSQTVETLFSFTDFNNFKANMLDYHERNNKKKNAQIEHKKLDLNLDFEVFNKYFKADNKEWEKVLESSEEGELDVYLQKLDGGVLIVKSEILLKDLSPEAIVNASVDYDLEAFKKKNPYIKEAYFIENKEDQNSDDKITYWTYDIPMMGARESIIKAGKREIEDFQVVFQHSIDLPEYPIKKDVKRNEFHRQIYVRKVPDSNLTKMVSIVFSQSDYSELPPMFMVMTMAKQTKEGMQFYLKSCYDEQERLNNKE